MVGDEAMKDKKYVVRPIILIISIFSIGIAVTYAYFQARLFGDDSSTKMGVSSDDVSLTYSNGSEIDVIDIVPGWSDVKNFQVDVVSKKDFIFDINLVVDHNNFYKTKSNVNGYGSSYLEYALYECSSLGSGCNTLVKDYTILDKSSGDIVVSSLSKADGTYYYQLVLRFPNNPSENQIQTGVDNNVLSFKGYVTLASSDKI